MRKKFKLYEWVEAICENPIIELCEDPWNGYDKIKPCGKCILCKRNIKLAKGNYKDLTKKEIETLPRLYYLLDKKIAEGLKDDIQNVLSSR